MTFCIMGSDCLSLIAIGEIPFKDLFRVMDEIDLKMSRLIGLYSEKK